MSQTILLVEDDPSWREILSELLEDMGLEVRAAANYAQALARLDGGPFAMALFDVSLDDADHGNHEGLRLLERFRTRYPQTPSVVLTGYATVDLAIRALTVLGAEDLLRKEQFDRDRFQQTISRVLALPPRGPIRATPAIGAAAGASGGTSTRLDARILVVEDNPAWQSIYHELLDEIGASMALAVSYGEARGLLQRERFDAAVVDLRLASSTEPDENRDGFHLLRLTRERALPTIVVSALGEPRDIDRAYEEFAIFTFLDKEGFQRSAFLETLRIAATEVSSPRPPGIITPGPGDENPLAALTERQLEVLALLAQGKTNNEIADEIVVSVNTVKKHVLAIFGTLGVNSRAAAAALAARYGVG